MSEFIGVPDDLEVQEQIIERTLQKMGALMEIRLVKRKSQRQYEAALFINHKYMPGPPLPRPLETPAGDASHWMGVRPKVGLTTSEVEKILYEVNGVNALYHITIKDTWGRDAC